MDVCPTANRVLVIHSYGCAPWRMSYDSHIASVLHELVPTISGNSAQAVRVWHFNTLSFDGFLDKIEFSALICRIWKSPLVHGGRISFSIADEVW